MKVNSVSLKFTNADEEHAVMEIVTDPVELNFEELDVNNIPPCMQLAHLCMQFLMQHNSLEGSNVEQRSNTTLIH